MREKNWFIFAIVFSLVHSGTAFADCHEDAEPAVSQALVDQTGEITDQVGDKLTDDQIKLLGERVKDLQNGANVLSSKAEDAKADLSTQVECGAGIKISKAQCIQKQIDFDKGRMDIMSDEAKAKTQAEVDDLQAQLDKPKTISEASSNYAQASSVLQEMIKTNDFSWKEHFGIIGKALLTSWKALITPGPIIAISAGAAGAGAAYGSGLDKTDKDWALHAGPAPAISKVTDQIGYAYPVLAPFLIIAAITKDNQTMKTFDALAVGSAISEAINFPTKYIVGRERPNGSDNLSFYSAHASETFMMATVLDHEYPGHHHIVGITATAGAALVSYYRAREGMHYPSDLAMGIGVGVASGIAASRAVDAQFDAAEGVKHAYWKDAALGNFRIPKTDKVMHCVPVGLAGSCDLTW